MYVLIARCLFYEKWKPNLNVLDTARCFGSPFVNGKRFVCKTRSSQAARAGLCSPGAVPPPLAVFPRGCASPPGLRSPRPSPSSALSRSRGLGPGPGGSARCPPGGGLGPCPAAAAGAGGGLRGRLASRALKKDEN